MKRKNRAVAAVLLIIMLFTFITGCLSISADELYSLPEISEEYIRLQAQINVLLSRGAVYAPPARGLNRQAVQLRDINSNGVNEVIAFFSLPAESKLRIYIFSMVDDDYEIEEIIESVGTEIESVRYTDMDGDGNLELVIGWQMGSALKYMSIYSIVDFHSQLLVNGEEYNEIATLSAADSDSENVVVLKLPTQETGNAVAKLFSLMKDGEVIMQETRLSGGVESINRILAGKLLDDANALFVEGEGRFDDGSIVTDVLTVRDGSFLNISMNHASGVSADTIRQRMNSADINNDGIVCVPALRRLVAQSETEYYAIDWYAYRSNGSRMLALTTYHNTFDEWYLILPANWRGKVAVRREDTVPGERTIIFSYVESANDEIYDDFLKIYRLSGDDARERMQRDGKIPLHTEGSVAYAFELLTEDNSFGITFSEDLIRENFKLIYTQWQP